MRDDTGYRPRAPPGLPARVWSRTLRYSAAEAAFCAYAPAFTGGIYVAGYQP
jgi:hypothetical protein